MSPRIVICPHGLPMLPEAREWCFDVLFRCGGDATRVFEGQPGRLAGFATHLAKIHAIQADDAPLVLLRRTNPLGLAVLQTRRALEEAVPRLERALWLIDFDEAEDPFFVDAATKNGAFDRALDDAPIWSGPDDLRFLVIGRRTRDLAVLPGRIAELEGEIASSPMTVPVLVDDDVSVA